MIEPPPDIPDDLDQPLQLDDAGGRDFTLRSGCSMTGEAISLVDFADTFAAKTNSLDMPDVHPSGAATIWRWLLEMRAAAEAGQAADVARIARMVTEKVALERQWLEEDLRG